MKNLFNISIFIILFSMLHATIINVPADQTTIQAGIDAAANTDTVLVQPGTYVENINFNGKLITVGSLFITTADTSYISTTVIDGDSSGSVVTFSSGEDSTAVLSGFKITNGYSVLGGGVFCQNSNPRLEYLIVTGNTASSLAGGIECDNCIDLSLNHITIANNSGMSAGGIDLYQSSVDLENVTITGNSVSHQGGGIICDSSTLTAMNVTISGNFAYDEGGGFYCVNNSNITISNSILWDNTPQEIYLISGLVTTTYTDIEGGWSGTGNIDSNPMFVDAYNGNYNLLYNSSCINTGDPSSSLDPDGTRADMGAYYFDYNSGIAEITDIVDIPNDQGRSVIVTWQRSIYDDEYSIVPIVSYDLWEMYPFELDGGCIVTNDINEAINKKDTHYAREDTIWIHIDCISAMQWDEYSTLAETFLDSTFSGEYLSYFFVSAHTPRPTLYFTSSIVTGYSVDNIVPDETKVDIEGNGNNMNLSWDEIEYGTFQGNSYPEINGIWYKVYAGDIPDFVCDEAHLIDTVTNLNYNYPIGIEEKRFFKIVVSDQP